MDVSPEALGELKLVRRAAGRAPTRRRDRAGSRRPTRAAGRARARPAPPRPAPPVFFFERAPREILVARARARRRYPPLLRDPTALTPSPSHHHHPGAHVLPRAQGRPREGQGPAPRARLRGGSRPGRRRPPRRASPLPRRRPARRPARLPRARVPRVGRAGLLPARLRRGERRARGRDERRAPRKARGRVRRRRRRDGRRADPRRPPRADDGRSSNRTRTRTRTRRSRAAVAPGHRSRVRRAGAPVVRPRGRARGARRDVFDDGRGAGPRVPRVLRRLLPPCLLSGSGLGRPFPPPRT